MPQRESHFNISLNRGIFMSTILIQKQYEPKETLVQNTRKIEQDLHTSPSLSWEDFAGLSWILFDQEEF